MLNPIDSKVLPIYQALSFQKVLKGGKTEPLLFLVNKNNKPTPFVVKLFATEKIQKEESVANEVIGSVLASSFDLPVPQPAFIELTKDVIDLIPDKAIVKRILSMDRRLTFGCEFMPSFIQLRPNPKIISRLKKVIDFDTVFAFDTLIINSDRGNTKTNILVRGDGVYLIDHELAFKASINELERLSRTLVAHTYFNYHIFYSSLKNARVIKDSFFHTFHEYLSRLNINNVVPYLEQLNYHGHPTVKHELVLRYLISTKENSHNFVALIKSLVK